MIEDRLDDERGCGWRQPGGLYLVAGALSAPCGKLPMPLHKCNTCGGGIKPSRGFTWIKPPLLFGLDTAAPICESPFTWQDESHPCEGCPAGGTMPKRAGLLWVGGKFYSTTQDFIREAVHMGVSRRISAVPLDFKVGETFVFLAHREAIIAPPPEPGMRPGVFSIFRPTAIEYVVKGDETDEQLAALKKRGITPVRVLRKGEQHPLRGVEA